MAPRLKTDYTYNYTPTLGYSGLFWGELYLIYIYGGLEVAFWPLVPKFAGSNPAEAVGFLGGQILSTPSFGGEVKPSVPCRRFAACKRSLNLRGSRNLGKITNGHLSRPQFHLSLLEYLASLRTQRHVAAKVGTSKGGGKQ